ncbi:MAG TPA: flagellar biosynthetic protein FliR [Spongiibacteraceae bacterium]|mgnify:CR=1 FL=1|nr:flagellar biosynthetic protein FliR [Spongiibacteraceae bacterium]HCS27712.1 flagellar biosynthetic protein FliR [Spongiibacteraceae bacterium]
MISAALLSETQINAWLASAWLPFLRIGGAVIAAPLFGSSYVPVRVRLAIALLTAGLLIPVLPQAPAINPLGIESILMAANEILIGLCLGFLVQLVFEAVVFAGQTISMGMGLGFAMMVDPQRGTSVPILSQYLLIITLLIFMSMGGHLEFLALVANSFQIWPVGLIAIGPDALGIVVEWGGEVFKGALQIALPAVIALLVVQIGVGVISRAAPTLNLFAVGFPVAILVGYLMLEQLIPSLVPALAQLVDSAFSAANALLQGGLNG